MIIEIYNKESKEIIEEKNFIDDSKEFLSFTNYFSLIYDVKKYDWRVKEIIKCILE